MEMRLGPSEPDRGMPRVRIHDCPALERLTIAPCNSLHGPSPKCWWGLALERVPQIKQLCLRDVRELALDDSSALEKLDLAGCDVSAADFSKIVAGAPLVDVDLSSFHGDLGAALQELGKISSLRTLVVSSTALSESGIVAPRIVQAIGEPGHFKQRERSRRPLPPAVGAIGKSAAH